MKTEQVKWEDKVNNEIHGGILIDDRYLICGCCGGVFDLADDYIQSKSLILKQYEDWVNLDAEIIGGEVK